MNGRQALGLALGMLLAVMPAEAATLPGWLQKLKAKRGPSSASAHGSHNRVFLGAFTGGTGESARNALNQELIASHEFTVVANEADADYVVTGSSVGGRVSGNVKNREDKQLFERNYAAPGLDENLKALADDLIYAITGKPGLATSRIVFVSDKSGSRQIYICDANGQDVQQVTHDAHGAVAPSLSPDSSMVAFTSYGNGYPVVQLVDLGAGWERTVTDTPGSSFGAAFAPDGARLAVVMSFLGNPEIFVTNLNTNTAACISDSVGAPSSPSWHPSGKQLIFSDDHGQGSKLYIAEVPSGDVKGAKLFRWNTRYRSCTDPEWSPDGQSVAFTAQKGGDSAVVVKGYPEGGTRVVQGGGASHPSWSPNGRFLTYVQQGTLYIHDLNTGNRRAVLSGYGRISEPRWMR